MRNFTFGEIITIVVVILIVFGPNRLPELARKAGQYAAKARVAITSLREELGEEYREVAEPVIEARDQIRATGKELAGELSTLRDEVQADLDETRLEANRVLKGDGGDAGDTNGSSKSEATAPPDSTDADRDNVTRLPGVDDPAADGRIRG